MQNLHEIMDLGHKKRAVQMRSNIKGMDSTQHEQLCDRVSHGDWILKNYGLK